MAIIGGTVILICMDEEGIYAKMLRLKGNGFTSNQGIGYNFIN